jgi:hypothetical protein
MKSLGTKLTEEPGVYPGVAAKKGYVRHDARGNSIWSWNEDVEQFRDTQTWVLRTLDVPTLKLDDAPAAGGDPYNRGYSNG